MRLFRYHLPMPDPAHMPATTTERKPPTGLKATIRQTIARKFFKYLVSKTKNFSHTTWLGRPIWQNVFDLQTIQETIVELQPAIIIECGTNLGGSSMYYAHLFDLLAAEGRLLPGRGRIVSIDIEKLHDLSHPRITYLIGSSTAPDIFAQVKALADDAERSGEGGGVGGPVFVILDSDHSMRHVRAELELYAPLVSKGSFCLVQDGVIDVLPNFAGGRPGPLPAIHDYLKSHPEFEIDRERCDRFLITHHPDGWLRRK